MHRLKQSVISEKLHETVFGVRIWSFFGSYFPTFGLNTEIYGVSTEYLSVFSPNGEKYGPEKLRIWTLFEQ